MSETEKILRRKARRLNKAQILLSGFASDVKEAEMPEKEKNWILAQILELRKTVQNVDKEENIYNS